MHETAMHEQVSEYLMGPKEIAKGEMQSQVSGKIQAEFFIQYYGCQIEDTVDDKKVLHNRRQDLPAHGAELLVAHSSVAIGNQVAVLYELIQLIGSQGSENALAIQAHSGFLAVQQVDGQLPQFPGHVNRPAS